MKKVRDLHLRATLLALALTLGLALAVPLPPPLNVTDITPPPGNSVALVTVTQAASRTFRCVQGHWDLVSSFALLVDAHNTSQLLGNYTYDFNHTNVNITGLWSIHNSAEDLVESGQLYVVVSGEVVYFVNNTDPNSIPIQLVQITFRNFLTSFGSYSYVLANGTGGAHPNRTCDASETVVVPFQATYTLFTQDPLPPATIGLPVEVSRDSRFVQALFVTGFTNWTFNQGNWEFTEGSGLLFDLPGGTHLGSITIRSASITWTVSGPFGWKADGQLQASYSLSARDWPWQLYRINSFSGSSLLGAPASAQFISTRGGRPLPTAAAPPRQADSFSADFSSITWFFTSDNAI